MLRPVAGSPAGRLPITVAGFVHAPADYPAKPFPGLLSRSVLYPPIGNTKFTRHETCKGLAQEAVCLGRRNLESRTCTNAGGVRPLRTSLWIVRLPVAPAFSGQNHGNPVRPSGSRLAEWGERLSE